MHGRKKKLTGDDFLKEARTIIPDRLYFISIRGNFRHQDRNKFNFFTIDNTLKYQPFFVDFGPLHLGDLYRFCELLNSKLESPVLKDKLIIFYCAQNKQNLANAAYLIGAFQVLYLGKSVQEAWEPLSKMPTFIPFRDASMGLCTYRLTVLDCINAIYQAKQHNFIDFSAFDVDEYDFYEKVESGDLNTLIPKKFIAFSGPSNTHVDSDGYPALTPAHYVPIFNRFGVSTIIRLNRKCYDKRRFSRHGFDHFDLIFPDGSTPPAHIVQAFLKICEDATGVIAVHCKAGLGRTGTLIACYMMKHWRWTSRECIAWLRICRPGSVIGPQQSFLDEQQKSMWRAGEKPHTLSQVAMDMSDAEGECDKTSSSVESKISDIAKTPTNNKSVSVHRRRKSNRRTLLSSKASPYFEDVTALSRTSPLSRRPLTSGARLVSRTTRSRSLDVEHPRMTSGLAGLSASTNPYSLPQRIKTRTRSVDGHTSITPAPQGIPPRILRRNTAPQEIPCQGRSLLSAKYRIQHRVPRVKRQTAPRSEKRFSDLTEVRQHPMNLRSDPSPTHTASGYQSLNSLRKSPKSGKTKKKRSQH